jgi:hypothetical protein
MIETNISQAVTKLNAELEKAKYKLAQTEAEGINAIAATIQDGLTAEIEVSIKDPTKMTRESVKMWKARPEQAAKGYPIEAKVFIRDVAKGGTPPSKYLQAIALGEQRQAKPFEVLLIKQGVLPSWGHLTAARKAPKDDFGNVPFKIIKTALEDLKVKQYKQSKRPRKRGWTYVYMQPKGKSAGIWRRDDDARTIEPIFIFHEGKQPYRKIFEFFEKAQETFEKIAPEAMKVKIVNVFKQ